MVKNEISIFKNLKNFLKFQQSRLSEIFRPHFKSLLEKTKIYNSEKQNYEITTRLILSMEIPITITIIKSQH